MPSLYRIAKLIKNDQPIGWLTYTKETLVPNPTKPAGPPVHTPDALGVTPNRVEAHQWHAGSVQADQLAVEARGFVPPFDRIELETP